MARQNVGTNVEWMSRFTQNGQAEDVEARQLAADSAAPTEQSTVIAPGRGGHDDSSCNTPSDASA